MVKAVFDRNTKKLGGWARYDDLPHDPATHVQIKLAAPPSAADRWDGAKGVRPATAPELAADQDEDAQKDEDEALAKPGHLVGALIDLLFDHQKRIATLEGSAPPTRSEFRQALRATVRAKVRA